MAAGGRLTGGKMDVGGTIGDWGTGDCEKIDVCGTTGDCEKIGVCGKAAGIGDAANTGRQPSCETKVGCGGGENTAGKALGITCG